MAHNSAHYTITNTWGNTIKINASFWRDPEEPAISSIVTMDTGMAHLQISATAADFRALSALFQERACSLETAIANQEQAPQC